MVCSIIVIVSSLLLLYQFITNYFGVLMSINLIQTSNIVIEIVSGVALKWSLIFGLVGLVFGVLSLITVVKEIGESLDLDKIRIVTAVLYVIVTFLSVL